MAIAKETCELLNRYVKELFAGNAKIDNLYYNLKYKGYNNLADAIHEPVAHIMGELADRVTDMMDSLDARPVRYGLGDEIAEYEAEQCFEELQKYFDYLVEITYKVIEEVEMSEEYEVKIFMEDFLNSKLMPYRKQSHEWYRAIKSLGAETFNIHIGDYTHYIKEG